MAMLDALWDPSHMEKEEKTPLQLFVAKALQLMPQKRDWYDKRIQEKTGKTGKPLYDIERKRITPTLATLRNIAEVLGQPLDLFQRAMEGEIVEPIPIGEAPPSNVRQIPRLGRVPASALREALAEASGSVTVPIRVPKEAFALEVEGDSMDLVGAPEGADAIVDPNDRKLFSGDLYVIATEDGEATFKRYLEGPARLVPCSSNPAHREILIGAEPIRVIGRVTDVVIGAGLLRRMG